MMQLIVTVDNSMSLNLKWRVYKDISKFLTYFLKHELPKKSLLKKQSKLKHRPSKTFPMLYSLFTSNFLLAD